MVITKILGGLGNQMFQYAVAKAISIENNKPLFLNTEAIKHYKLHKYGLNHFNIQSNFYKPLNFWVLKFKMLFNKIVQYKETSFNFNKTLSKIDFDILYLDGYFQSEKYFIKYENEIRSDFEIISPLKKQTIETIELMKNVNSVSIHFRRGDYVGSAIHNTDKTNYYKMSIDLIETKVKNPVYFVFSDDINWVKNNFFSNFKTHFIDFNNAETNYEDLKLMSSCKHNIIANSSFSWWGAWLNQSPSKIVIAPKVWFMNCDRNYEDVIPESWIKL